MPAQFPEAATHAPPQPQPQPLAGGGSPSARWNADEEVVISGISGKFPECSNAEQFRDHLLAGTDLVTEDDRRWAVGLHGLPHRSGKLKDINRFDANFFGVHPKQAETMDPQIRMMLELTYEAMVDAGVNPQKLRGSRTGVFVGMSGSESFSYWCSEPDKVNGYGLSGCSGAMFANRISYTFDLKGPSFSVDTACSSSMMALHQAVVAMRTGQCDAAIVGGASLALLSCSALQFQRLSLLSPEGKCKSFDVSGNGYVRSEAAVIIFLQKLSESRRVYATVVNTKINADGFKENGIMFPSGEIQKRLIQDVYEEAGINPADVAYVEAHGTGTVVGDPQEVNTIADVFCKDRKSPLPIGSVKSNMGHAEPASGLCSIAKVLIAMENGVIPPNLHFQEPNPHIPALADGRLQVVTKPLPWSGGLVGINSFGFGGANGHAVLRAFPKPKFPAPQDAFPRLVVASACTEEGVHGFLEKIESIPRDDELLSLLHGIHESNIPGHQYRGYTILGVDTPTKEVAEHAGDKRPVWFVFSGMGSQWAGMAHRLMQIKVFARSINKCAKMLRPLDLDLIHILTRGTDETFDNVLNAFVSIVSVQVALVDTLSSLGIHADGIVGHSVGELACAYADGTFTAEQTVLAAYWRGRTICDAELPPGAMAAVGLSWEEAKSRCPEDICLACHNSADNVTVSGPTESVRQFVQELKEEGIFAKEVNSSGIAFHSRYIADLGKELRKKLDMLVPMPKQRSARWISSSVPEAAWHTPLAKLSSPAYHVNNLLSPVLFHEALAHVPEHAVVVEVAPHCLLQAVLRRCLPASCTSIGLVKRLHPDNLQFFIASLGKMFNAGLHPKLAQLYHEVKYPVGRGTPMIAPWVQWDHSTEWAVGEDPSKKGSKSGESIVEVNLSSEEDKYLLGHEIDGRLLFPATGYMTLVWKSFAKLQGKTLEEVPVVMEDVRFHRPVIMPKDGPVRFLVNIYGGSGGFEVCERGSVAATGVIRPLDAASPGAAAPPPPPAASEAAQHWMTSKEVYKLLRLRGYDYSGVFQGVVTADTNGTSGELVWKNNWVSFMDTLLQFSVLGVRTSSLYLPASVQRAVIDPRAHRCLGQDAAVPIHLCRDTGVIQAGGVELRGLQANIALRRQHAQAAPRLEKYTFVPYIAPRAQQATMGYAGKQVEEALTAILQVTLENSGGAMKLKIAELAGSSPPEALLSPLVVSILHGEPLVNVDVTVVGPRHEEYSTSEELAALGAANFIDGDPAAGPVGQNLHLVVGRGVLAAGPEVMANLASSLRPGGFLLLRESVQPAEQLDNLSGLDLVSVQLAEEDEMFVLLRKVEDLAAPLVVAVTDCSLQWLEQLRSAVKQSVEDNTSVLLLSQGEELCGLLGLVNCLKWEVGFVRCFFLRDRNAPEFSLDHPLYATQIKKNLLINVYQDGQWGSYRHISLEDDIGKTTLQVEHAYINTLTRGDLASLRWIEGPLSFYQPDLYPNTELCHVYYAPLNFRDVMLATGKLPPDALPGNMASQDCILGTEFSGRDSSGRRVMGLMPARGMATTVAADPRMLWPVPDHWTLEEACTVPVVYCTSYYALVVRGRMRRGDTLLVHAGSGGVGLASIAIALHMGVKVFTTVGSQEKREFLKTRFPQLTDRNIANSRDTSFEQHVMRETEGRGVDLVLNSLAEDKLQASVRCLARHGRFLEIGKFDLANNSLLGMSMFLKNTSFHGILLDSLFDSDAVDDLEVVRLLNEGIESGAVKPLPATVFAEDQAEQAFRFLASGKHIGKVALKIRNEEPEKVVVPTPKLVPAIPRVYLRPEKVYVLVGGLGGFGMELAKWMVLRGATRIVLTSRSGLKTGYQTRCVQQWRKDGLSVAVSTADCATEYGAVKLLSEANELGVVGGIFNLAAVLKDALLDNQSEEGFAEVCTPKVDATKNLDRVSRRLCPELDYFVVFSSVVSGRGNAGQTNYGMANSAMERICEARQADGLPGLAIQWGAIGDVGIIIDIIGRNDAVVGGTVPQRMSSCLATMDIFLQQSHPVVASMVLAERNHSGSGESTVGMLDTIAKIMGVKDFKKINPKNTLAEMGMDSLMGAEIKQTLERNYDIVLSPQEIRTMTIGQLLARRGSSGGQQASPSDNNLEKQQMESLPELVPSQVLTRLPSKAGDDSEEKPLFVVHAIDGSVGHLAAVSAELAMPVWGLQCAPGAPTSCVRALATFYLQYIEEKQPSGPYLIGGYSYGAMVAFEIGLQLQAKGKEVTLVLLDGSPGYITYHSATLKNLHEQGSALKEAQIIANILNHFADVNYDKVKAFFEALPSWEMRLAKCVEILSMKSAYSTEQLTVAAEAIRTRIEVGESYQPSEQYKGKVVLFKAKENYVTLGEDYGLSKICQQTPHVHVVEGNHKGILQGDGAKRIASIITAFTKA